MRLGRLFVVALLGVAAYIALASLGPSPASANFGDTCSTPPNGASCVSMANNKWHAVRKSNVDTSFWNSIKNVAVPKYNATDLSVYVTWSDPNPDVWVQGAWLGDLGPYAAVVCPSGALHGSHGTNLQWCRGQTLSKNTFWGFSPQFSNFTACHELGHTVGLRHRNSQNGCLNERSHTASWYPIYLTSHDISHLYFY